ncbi:unnamed protein product [Ectocarpus sp. CCAP 1310/34]|nr:unnamed protein product [Ectocarpus sp. CCAP 1310/34]
MAGWGVARKLGDNGRVWYDLLERNLATVQVVASSLLDGYVFLFNHFCCRSTAEEQTTSKM